VILNAELEQTLDARSARESRAAPNSCGKRWSNT
jgi:hypothetical protein